MKIIEQWYDLPIAKTVDEARTLGIERLQEKFKSNGEGEGTSKSLIQPTKI